jgi:putative ABC transport system permease protein
MIDALWRSMRTWTADVVHAIRTLLRAPGHVAAALVCLVLGIVACGAAFSVVNALFYRDLPGTSNHQTLRRVQVARAPSTELRGAVSTEDVRRLALLTSISRIASEGTLAVTTATDGDAFTAVAAFVSGDYFSVLGSRSAMGRALSERDDRASAEPVVVVSDLFWQRRLHARPDIIGHVIPIGGRSFTVVGVAAEGFSGLDISELGDDAGSRVQFWLPLSMASSWPAAPAAGDDWHSLAVRLASGTTDDRASGELTAALRRPGVQDAGDVRVGLVPMNVASATLPREVTLMIAWFLSLPLMVLVIGCINVANLQLTRATDRAREIALRAALGASRLQLVRLLSAEAIVLAGLAAAAGIAGTMAALQVIEAFVPLSLVVDWRVVALVAGLAGVVVLLAGLAPAWLSTRRAAAAGLIRAAQPGGRGQSRARGALVTLQTALSFVLLVVTAIFARSLMVRYETTPPVVRELAVGAIQLRLAGYDGAGARRFLDDINAHLSQDARVQHVAAQSLGELRYVPGNAEGRAMPLSGGYVTPSWFSTVDVRPHTGRLFTAGDEAVAVINDRLASELASLGGSPLGRLLRIEEVRGGQPFTVEVVGIIPDVGRPPDTGPFRGVYLPMPATPPTSLTVVVRTAAPAELLSELRSFLTTFDNRLAWGDLSTGVTLLRQAVSPIRYIAASAGLIGVLALLLASAGLYAVMSYTASLRRREIGIRLALGARPVDVTRLVLGQAGVLVARGLVVGLMLALPAMYLVRFLFEGVSPADPIAIGAALFVLVASGLVAAGVPARRAAFVDPMESLREE